MRMVVYELKLRRKSVLFLFFGVLIFLGVHLMMLKAPQIIINIVQLINRSDIVMDFLGIEEEIKAVTHENVMMVTMTGFCIAALYRNMVDTADSVSREECLGTQIYFLSQQVSGARIALSKIIVSLFIFIVEMIVWGTMVWRFSLYGASEIEYLWNRITEEIGAVMEAFYAVCVLGIAVGFLYGCLSQGRKAGNFVGNLLVMECLIAIVPNVLRMCAGIFERKGGNVEGLEKVNQIMFKIRDFDPVYWCNPMKVINDGGSAVVLWCCLTGSVILIGIGCWIYNRKET